MAILVVGLILGIYGIVYPLSTTTTQTTNIVPSQNYKVDGNGYHSQSVTLSASQTVQVSTTMNVSTLFNFMIMNTSQYRNFYGCAPACHSLPGAPAGKFASFVNASVTPSSAYNKPFTAPSADTYYFVFDNTVGQNYTQYTQCAGPSATCNGPTATGTFSVTQSSSSTSYSTNWTFVAPGAILLVIGGAIGSAGSSGKKAEKPPGAGTATPPKTM